MSTHNTPLGGESKTEGQSPSDCPNVGELCNRGYSLAVSPDNLAATVFDVTAREYPLLHNSQAPHLVVDYKRVILLGTAEQMTSPRIRKPLAASGVLVLVPGEADRARIQQLCCAQTLDEAELAWFGQMLEHGLEHGAQAILLACEDLRAAVEAVTSTVPIIMVSDR